MLHTCMRGEQMREVGERSAAEWPRVPGHTMGHSLVRDSEFVVFTIQ